MHPKSCLSASTKLRPHPQSSAPRTPPSPGGSRFPQRPHLRRPEVPRNLPRSVAPQGGGEGWTGGVPSPDPGAGPPSPPAPSLPRCLYLRLGLQRGFFRASPSAPILAGAAAVPPPASPSPGAGASGAPATCLPPGSSTVGLWPPLTTKAARSSGCGRGSRPGSSPALGPLPSLGAIALQVPGQLMAWCGSCAGPCMPAEGNLARCEVSPWGCHSRWLPDGRPAATAAWEGGGMGPPAWWGWGPARCPG